MTPTDNAFYFRFAFDGFDIYWAGADPFGRPGFCFGSGDGRLLFTDEHGEPIGEPQLASKSGEAVNGVAAAEGVLAVTTRDDATFWRMSGKQRHKWAGRSKAGAHGVTVTPDNYFLLPMGPDGVAVVPAHNPGGGFAFQPLMAGEAATVLRVVGLRGPAGGATVCAMRRNGVGTSPFDGTLGRTMTASGYPGIDVIDVCGIGPVGQSVAAVALSRDGTLVFIRDALSGQTAEPVGFTWSDTWEAATGAAGFAGIAGPARRVLSSRGHLYVLTDSAFHILFAAADAYLQGGHVPLSRVRGFTQRVTAIDAAVYRDRYLLLVLDDGTAVLCDIAEIELNSPAVAEPGRGLPPGYRTGRASSKGPMTTEVFDLAGAGPT